MAAARLSRLRGTRPYLRIITFVLAVITTILIGAAARTIVSTNSEYYASDWILLITLPFSLYTVLYCAVTLSVLFFRGSYHPGIDIGFDVVGWGANWGWSSIVFIEGAWIATDGYVCSETSYYHYDCGQARILKRLMLTVGVFMVLYGTTHLVLFVLACKATHERRLRKKAGFVIELDDMDPLKNNAAPQT